MLKSLGHDVHVLEKSPAELLRSQAAGLSAGPDVQKFIREYIRPTHAYAKVAEKLEIIDVEGGVINPIPSKEPYHLSTWSLLYTLFKDRFLAEGGYKARYETETCVRGVQRDGAQLVVAYSHIGNEAQQEIRADLVIAADGAHSTVRNAILPGVSPQYTGFVTWRGAVPASAMSEESRKVLDNRFLIFRTENGYTVS